jgi:hypothetical protein
MTNYIYRRRISKKVYGISNLKQFVRFSFGTRSLYLAKPGPFHTIKGIEDRRGDQWINKKVA